MLKTYWNKQKKNDFGKDFWYKLEKSKNIRYYREG